MSDGDVMPTVDIELEVEVKKTARLAQISAITDYELPELSTFQLSADLPIDDMQWNVGAIVGASGTGKTTLSSELFGDHVFSGNEWDNSVSLVDNFPKGMSIRDVTHMLSSVGFNTVPNWMRPYRVLSNGEMFRADLALAIATASADAPLVYDEFSSVVDRQVAKIASHSVQKSVRSLGLQFVAVSL